METFQELDQDPEHKNWYKCLMTLRVLHKHLKPFIDVETEKLHKELLNICSPHRCDNNCSSKNQGPNQGPTFDCDVWKKAIQKKHQSGKLMWVNSESHLWPEDKWAVAKVYMPGGHKKHNSIGDFDIHSFVTLMHQCKHFERFELGGLCNKVSSVRNCMMHSPKYQLDQEDFSLFLGHITDLGDQLSKQNSGFKKLAEEINEILKLEYRLVETKEYEKEVENKISTALQLVSEYRYNQDSLKKEVVTLEQRLSERDMEIQDLRLSNKIKLQTQETLITLFDRMQSSVERVATDHYNTRVKLENLEQQMARQEQEKVHLDFNVMMLQQRLSERDKEIQALRSSYTNSLQRQQENIARRDREIQRKQSAPVERNTVIMQETQPPMGLIAVIGGVLLALFAIL